MRPQLFVLFLGSLSLVSVSFGTKINGFCVTSFPYQSNSVQFNQSFALMMKLGPGWAAVVEDWGQENINSTSIYPVSFSQNTTNLVAAISVAKAAGLKVALKPMVDVTNDSAHWRGEIGLFFSAREWQAWFASYQAYMANMSLLASGLGVDLLIIGTELTTTESQTSLWTATIRTIKAHFGGPLLYGANHPAGEFQPWWQGLDYIGLDAYYPLTTNSNPTVAEIAQGWAQYIPYFEQLSTKYGVQVMFPELGYQSLADTTVTPWAAHGALSMQAQANAFDAYFQTIYPQPWFAGAFFWAWTSDPTDGGLNNTDFSVLNKPAAAIISSYFHS